MKITEAPCKQFSYSLFSPTKLLSNQEKMTCTYCQIFSHFHHTSKCEHLPKLRAVRAALSLHSPKDLDTPKPTTRKLKKKTSSSTTNPFQASTFGRKGSVDSHTIFSVGTVVPCTICTGHNHEPEACTLME